MSFSFGRLLPSCLVMASLLAFEAVGKPSSWKKIKSEKGVEVFEKKMAGGLAFRGIGEIKGSPAKLVAILQNPKRWKHWIDRFASGRVLRDKSPFVKIYYQSFKSPFPVEDRDLVFESKTSRDPESGDVIVSMRSVKHPDSPRTVGVRVNLRFASYRMETIAKDRMRVTFETFSDPGGAIPGFLTDWAARAYPITLFEGLRKEMARPGQKEAPLPR